MKQVSSFLMVVFLSAGLLIACQELTPLTPPNPVVGNWVLDGWQEYHLPAWFVTYSHTPYTVTPTDTIYSNGIGGSNGIRSFTLAQDNTFSENYIVKDFTTGETRLQTDTGSWTLADTVVSLSVANDFPHKLTYRYATNQLVVDKAAQSTLIWFNGDPRDTVRVSYTVRLYYRRGNP